MSRNAFDRYSCDASGCLMTAEVRANSEAPIEWGYISIARLRGHSNVGLWLCREHFAVIDGLVYPASAPIGGAS